MKQLAQHSSCLFIYLLNLLKCNSKRKKSIWKIFKGMCCSHPYDTWDKIKRWIDCAVQPVYLGEIDGNLIDLITIWQLFMRTYTLSFGSKFALIFRKCLINLSFFSVKWSWTYHKLYFQQNVYILISFSQVQGYGDM